MEIKVCAFIPFYNNRGTLENVAKRVHQQIPDLILLNDGCTDSSDKTVISRPGQILLHHNENRGKGVAVKTAAEYAIANGFTHLIQIDADDQMDPSDIPRFIDAISNQPESVIIGYRKMDESTPRASRFGRWFSNLWFRIETLGYPISDSQSGYRAYPLQLFSGLRSVCDRMDFEVEILVLALLRGHPIIQIPVNIHYFQGNERVSHFRKFHDNVLISLLHTRMCLSLAYQWPALLHALRRLRIQRNE